MDVSWQAGLFAREVRIAGSRSMLLRRCRRRSASIGGSEIMAPNRSSFLIKRVLELRLVCLDD